MGRHTDRHRRGVAHGEQQDRLGAGVGRAGQYGPGSQVTRTAPAERIGDDGEPGAVLEDCLDLDLGDHVRDPGQKIVGGQDGSAVLDRHGQPMPVTGRLAHRVRDQRGRLGDVETEPPCAAGAGQFRRGEQQQPVPLRGRQGHDCP